MYKNQYKTIKNTSNTYKRINICSYNDNKKESFFWNFCNQAIKKSVYISKETQKGEHRNEKTQKNTYKPANIICTVI